MSHVDDIDSLDVAFPALGFVGLALAVVGVVWALAADSEAADVCAARGEKYVDSRAGYVLCEGDGGVVVKR